MFGFPGFSKKSWKSKHGWVNGENEQKFVKNELKKLKIKIRENRTKTKIINMIQLKFYF
jgi:hypothetical protein